MTDKIPNNITSQLLFLLLAVTIIPFGASAKDHRISLGRYRLNIRRMEINIAEVRDTRADKTGVGIVKKGIFNKRVLAKMKNGLLEEVGGF